MIDKMKCPKCKKEMRSMEEGNMVSKYVFLYCENKKCEYYGLKRFDFDEFDKGAD